MLIIFALVFGIGLPTDPPNLRFCNCFVAVRVITEVSDIPYPKKIYNLGFNSITH